MLATGKPQKIPPLPRLKWIESESVGITLDTSATDSIPYILFDINERGIHGTHRKEFNVSYCAYVFDLKWGSDQW